MSRDMFSEWQADNGLAVTETIDGDEVVVEERPRVDPKWGKVYGDTVEPHYITTDGVGVWMWRKGQRVRFFDAEGQEHGVEQRNVAPALVYAAWCGWRDPSHSEAFHQGLRSEVRRKTTFR